MLTKRNGYWYIYFYPFKTKKIGIKLPDVTTKGEAKQVEAAILRACRNSNYSTLDPVSREACIRMFENQKWKLPAELGGDREPKRELTLVEASKLFLKYPDINKSSARPRYEMCIVHLVEHFGRERPIETIWVPEVKRYQVERRNSGASPSTVNWEKGTLSKIFQVLVELRFVEANPCRLVKNLSQKSEERQAYLSKADVQLVATQCPGWFRHIIWMAYYTGMRRGEILGLTRKQLNISKRMITLSPDDTKECRWKRIPVHGDLVPVLEKALKVTSLGTDKVFLLKDGPSIRPLALETFKNPWPRACEALKEKKLLKEPLPRFHDLRHTWKTNARRSRMDSEIREAILGHAERGKSVTERYGRISDQEFVEAIDGMVFDNGDTEVLVASPREKRSTKNSNSIVTGAPRDKKRSCATMT